MEESKEVPVQKHLMLMMKMLLNIDSWRKLSSEERGYLQFVNRQVFKENAVSIKDADDRKTWIEDVKTYYDCRLMTREEALEKTKDARLFGL